MTDLINSNVVDPANVVVEPTQIVEGEVKTEVVNTENTIDPAIQEFVKKEAQREADRVRTEYSKKLKEKETALEELKKSMMDAETRAKYEQEQKQKALEERALELEKKNAEYVTLKLLVDNGLNPEFKDFFKVSSSEEEITESINKFKTIFNTEVLKAAEAKIKGMATNVAPVQQQQVVSQPRQTVINSNNPMDLLKQKRINN